MKFTVRELNAARNAIEYARRVHGKYSNNLRNTEEVLAILVERLVKAKKTEIDLPDDENSQVLKELAAEFEKVSHAHGTGGNEIASNLRRNLFLGKTS